MSDEKINKFLEELAISTMWADDFASAIKTEKDFEVIKEDVPMFIEVDISRKEHVLPMVPAGKSNHEMLGVKFNA